MAVGAEGEGSGGAAREDGAQGPGPEKSGDIWTGVGWRGEQEGFAVGAGMWGTERV